MRAHHLVREVFDRPYPVKIFKDQAVAKDERGKPLWIDFTRTPTWETVKVTFDRGKGFELTDWGNEFRIFATVVSAIQQWSAQYRPDALYFSVENDEPNNRQRLYDRMVKKLASSTDYQLVTDPAQIGSDTVRYYAGLLGRRFSDARYWWLVRRDLVTSAPTVTEAASAGVTQTQLYVPRPNGLVENWSIKPQGVLWTSTARKTKDGWTSDWVEWCRANQPDWLSEQGILYDVRPGAQFLNLNTDRDAVKAARRCGVEISNEYDLFRSMPWQKISQDFDAIHHVPSQRAGNLFMSTWDVESTAWFDRSHLVNPRQVKISSTADQDLDEGWRDLARAAALGTAVAAGGAAVYDRMKSAPPAQPVTTAPAPQAFAVPRVTGSPLEGFLARAAHAAGLRGTELAQFLAQAAHETGDFQHMRELGASRYFDRYEPRMVKMKKTGEVVNVNPRAQRLGNDQPGDGARYRGRGFLQITGKDNYRRLGAALGLPLEQQPELLEQPEIAARAALWFWKNRVVPRVQDFADTHAATRAINPALQGLEDRRAKFVEYVKQLRTDTNESQRHDREWVDAVDRHVRLRAMAKRERDEAKFNYHNDAIKKLYGNANPPVTPVGTFNDDPGGIEIDENSVDGTNELYHGTLVKNVPSILANGLNPTVGEFTNSIYKNKAKPLVFAADLKGSRAVYCALASQIGILLGKFPPSAEDIAQHGAILVISKDVGKFKQYTSSRRQGSKEPTDYTSQETISIDRVIKGRDLLQWIKTHNADRGEMACPVSENFADEELTETRERMFQYIKQILPKWPDYVLRDWIYNLARGELKAGDWIAFGSKDDAQRYPALSRAAILEFVRLEGLGPDTTWRFFPRFEFTWPQLSPETRRKLQARQGGRANPYGVPRDAERHSTQAKLAQQQGGVRSEPVIGKMTADGFELIEGWHRTVQHFVMHPQGYYGPAWVAMNPRPVKENFADKKVKGKSRPGRVKRAGASCAGSVTDLRARAAKYGGERGKMYHWCANMKAGRKKK